VQVKVVKVCNSSKLGPALVVETSPQSGGYVLGFRIEPRETLDYVHKELSSLLQVGCCTMRAWCAVPCCMCDGWWWEPQM
jgi:hypothetical protein